MNRGYCSNCRQFVDSGEYCDKCGGRLTYSHDRPYPQGGLKGRISDLKYNDKLTMIGLICLFMYNLIGFIVSFVIGNKIIDSNKKFLMRINISHFWLWLLIIINILLFAGAVLLYKNKSVLCAAGQGLLWLMMILATAGIKELDYKEVEIAWKDGVETSFSAATQVSRAFGAASFSIGHLFVIVLWIAAVVFISLGRTRESLRDFK